MKTLIENLPVSILVKRQKKVVTKQIDYYGKKCDLIVTIRYDDECGNKHNSFAITGDIYKHGRRNDASCLCGGCIHDDIEKYMPELKHLIKWHLCSSDGPMHYVANSLYHARTKTHDDFEIGEAVSFNRKFKFKGFPFTFSQAETGFWEYLDSVDNFNTISVEPVKYDGTDSYDFSDNFSLTGFIKENELKQWYKAPFKNKESAREFLEALQTCEYEYIKIPSKWCEAVDSNLEAARNSAIWPDAELSDFTKENLENRLPELMSEFKAVVESLDFVY